MRGLGCARDLRDHVERNGFDRLTAIAAVCSHAVCRRIHCEGLVVDAHDGIDRVDEGHGVRAPVFCCFGGRQDIGDVWSEFDDDGDGCRGLGPFRSHLYVFRHLAYCGTHAALGHAVRATEVEFDCVGPGVLDHGHVLRPDLLVHWIHHRDHERPVGPVALDLADLVEVGLQRPVGDQFDVIETDHAAVVAMDGTVAGATHVHDRRVFAECLPHSASPAGFEGPVDVVGLVRRRCRSEPERIRRPNAEEFRIQVSHSLPPLCASSGRSLSPPPCRAERRSPSGRRHRPRNRRRPILPPVTWTGPRRPRSCRSAS